MLKHIKDKIVENRTIKDKNFFSQFIIICEIDEGVYSLMIDSIIDIYFKDDITSGIITRKEIDDLVIALEYSKKWLKDYTDKNFKELSDDEKLYMELGE